MELMLAEPEITCRTKRGLSIGSWHHRETATLRSQRREEVSLALPSHVTKLLPVLGWSEPTWSQQTPEPEAPSCQVSPCDVEHQTLGDPMCSLCGNLSQLMAPGIHLLVISFSFLHDDPSLVSTWRGSPGCSPSRSPHLTHPFLQSRVVVWWVRLEKGGPPW